EDVLSLIKGKEFRELNRRLATILGTGFSLKDLGLKW
ncbi:MAG: hypothetical protein H6Q44_319, partial [Deltaproteobacteria bacterium]|nr:hypothetical protein [Deltaproteobacteria bacterium]